MKPAGVSGYRFICDHAMMQDPPGVITTDERTLMDWARLSAREWDANKMQVLENFVQYQDKSGEKTWHHEYIKGLFREYHHQNWKASANGRAAVQKRWDKKRKSGGSEEKIQVYTDPYHTYTKLCIQTKDSTKGTIYTQTDAPGAASSVVDVDDQNIPIGRVLRQALQAAKGVRL